MTKPTDPAPRKMQPGDLCRFIKTDGKVTHVEHVAPCRDHYATGTITDVRTGKVLSR